MSSVVEQLIEYNLSDVAKIIAREEDVDAAESLTKLFGTRLFDGIMDPETGLYLQSPSYLYELYRRERNTR